MKRGNIEESSKKERVANFIAEHLIENVLGLMDLVEDQYVTQDDFEEAIVDALEELNLPLEEE